MGRGLFLFYKQTGPIMPTSENYQVVVIGSGPGGYVAAIRCAQLGKSVAVVERDRLGGVCLNMGCIPSKSLIRHASLFRTRTALESLGLSIDSSRFDYARVFAASRRAADTLSRGVAWLMKKNGITVITGSGALTSDRTVMVDGSREIHAANIIIATGSRSSALKPHPRCSGRLANLTSRLGIRSERCADTQALHPSPGGLCHRQEPGIRVAPFSAGFGKRLGRLPAPSFAPSGLICRPRRMVCTR